MTASGQYLIHFQGLDVVASMQPDGIECRINTPDLLLRRQALLDFVGSLPFGGWIARWVDHKVPRIAPTVPVVETFMGVVQLRIDADTTLVKILGSPSTSQRTLEQYLLPHRKLG